MNKFGGVLLVLVLVILVLVGCGKEEEENAETNLDLGSGTKENLPVSLELLIHYAERSKEIYDNGGSQRDEVDFTVTDNGTITVITIRGTANSSNVTSDLDAALVSDVRSGVRLHRGFRSEASIIYDIISRNNSLQRTVHITGHSLGGAIASIIGRWMELENGNNHDITVFSFGAPRVSNSRFPYGKPRHWRVANETDPITFLPIFPYIHSGTYVNPQTLNWGRDYDNGSIDNEYNAGSNHYIAKYVELLKGNYTIQNYGNIRK